MIFKRRYDRASKVFQEDSYWSMLNGKGYPFCYCWIDGYRAISITWSQRVTRSKMNVK